MTFSDQSIYNRMFQRLIYKRGESEINYIKLFKIAKALEILVGQSYSEDHLMQTLLEDLYQDGKIL